jgi:predicted phosphodiesterase
MSDLEDELEAETLLEARHKAEAAGKDPDLAELEELAARVHAKGIDYRIEGGKLVPTSVPLDVGREFKIDLGKEHLRLGIVSDTHGGSHSEQLSALRNFYQFADGTIKDPSTGKFPIPVDAFIHAGDFTQGSDRMHPDQPYQVHAHGAEQQVGYVVGTYPQSVRGTKTYAIAGNHDDSFLKDGGMNVVRQIASARPDIVYLGQTAAYLTIGGCKMYVQHPSGGIPYAKSYRLQKVAEGLPISKPTNMLLMGHLHSYCVVQHHGITAILLPCFQGQYGWLAGKGLHPDIGGIIADVWLTANGEVARISHEVVRYQSVQDDWDHEISREVSRGWSPKGLDIR